MGLYEVTLARLREVRELMTRLSADERLAIGARLAETGEGPTEQRSREAWERLRRAVLEHGRPLLCDSRGHDATDTKRDLEASAKAFPTWDERVRAGWPDPPPSPSAESIEAVRDALRNRGVGADRTVTVLHHGMECRHCGEQITLIFNGALFLAANKCPVASEPPSFVIEVTREAPRVAFSANSLAMVIPHLHDHEDALRKAAGVRTLTASLTRDERRLYAQHYFNTRRLVVLSAEGTPSLAFLSGTAGAPAFTIRSWSYALDHAQKTGGPDGPFRIDDTDAGLIVAAEHDFERTFGKEGALVKATYVPVPPGRYRVTVDALARKQAPDPEGRRRFVTITSEP